MARPVQPATQSRFPDRSRRYGRPRSAARRSRSLATSGAAGMQRFAWQLPALISLLASLTGLSLSARAETRPRYGGRLTVEIHDPITFTDPAGWPPQLVALGCDRLGTGDEGGGAPRAAAA